MAEAEQALWGEGMSISNISFDGISERELLDQIQAGIPEGVLIDYKRNAYGRADADVKEFLKDVSSFANTAGGHLVIGIDEAAGIPTAITALSESIQIKNSNDWRTFPAMDLSRG